MLRSWSCSVALAILTVTCLPDQSWVWFSRPPTARPPSQTPPPPYDPCEVGECCSQKYVRTQRATKDLEKRVKNDYFGQEIALDTILPALSGHLRDPNPGKPLVLSFHGDAGIGKSYLAELIVEAIYRDGKQSAYVKTYHCAKEFKKNEAKVVLYQERIEKDILDTLRQCPRSIFIFDEVDMMAPTVLDPLVAFLDRDNVYKDLDQKKAIYIFLCNSGAKAINKVLHKEIKKGRTREQLTIKDFETFIRDQVFNAKGQDDEGAGMRRAKIIERVLVDYFVPFLPLEERHVIQCIEAELKKRNHPLDKDMISTIVNRMTFDTPGSIPYSTTGCKHVEAKVKGEIARKNLKNEL